MSRCLKYRVKEAFCAVQGLRVLGGRQAGKPPTVKRTALKFRTKCSRHGREPLTSRRDWDECSHGRLSND